MINKTFHCKFPETCMENRKTREDLTKANTDLMFEIVELKAKVKELEGDVTHLTSCQSELARQREELTKLVASLEEVRAQEYAFKQAKVDDYKTMFEGMKKSYESNAARVIALEAKVEELEAQLSMHSDIDRLVVRTIKKLDELDIVKEEGE